MVTSCNDDTTMTSCDAQTCKIHELNFVAKQTKNIKRNQPIRVYNH